MAESCMTRWIDMPGLQTLTYHPAMAEIGYKCSTAANSFLQKTVIREPSCTMADIIDAIIGDGG
jgi:hypothetical protein